MPEQARNAIDDREAEAETALRPLRTLRQAVELLENGFLIALGNTDAGINDLDGNTIAATPAANQYTAFPRITAGVADEILKNPPQQCGVGMNNERRS